jgi:hypothetical protein
MNKLFNCMTEQYSPALMSKFYLIRAGVNQYVWFDSYESAHKYLLSEWVDSRFANEIATPAN